MRAKHYVGGLMMLIPVIAVAFVPPPILFGFLIAFPIGWQLFFSEGKAKGHRRRPF